jgi:hypothetical protein
MILKVQALQRRLIGQTEAVAERELQLAEQGKGLAALRAALARQPGPGAIEQLGGMQARSLPQPGNTSAPGTARPARHALQGHVPVTGQELVCSSQALRAIGEPGGTRARDICAPWY